MTKAIKANRNKGMHETAPSSSTATKLAQGVKSEDDKEEVKPKRRTKENKEPKPKKSKRAPPNTTDIYRTFVGGFEGTKGRKWLYVGQYRLIEVDDLTLQEWVLQDNKVK